RELAHYLSDRHSPVIYREHAGVHPIAGGHFFPSEILPDLMAWLESTRREETPKEILMVRDRDHPGQNYWLRLDEPAPEVVSWQALPEEMEAAEDPPKSEPVFARLSAVIKGNEITVRAEHVLRYSLLLQRDLLNLDQPVRVTTNGAVSFEGTVTQDSRQMLREAHRRSDPRMITQAVLEIPVPR
ncbi:MAG TPA: hypothetical protein VI702_04830, partial [Nitrospiria bacterium]